MILVKRILKFLFLFCCLSLAAKNDLVEINGAGATFPQPLYTNMFMEYSKINNSKVNYQGIGSGGGVKQLFEKTIDFGATDFFINDETIKTSPAKIIHVPICVGGVVLIYNLPNKVPLNLSSKIIAGIFLGTIKKWNDKQVIDENPNVKLPNLEITVVHRSDASGTTYVFTDYLSKVNKEWKEKVGTSIFPKWSDRQVAAKGNTGVAGLIVQIPGSIGYVESVYALKSNLAFAAIKNNNGKYILPSLDSLRISGDVDMPEDTRVSITNTEAKDGYPISSYTWIILYKEQNYNNKTNKHAKSLIELLWWMIHDGQSYTQKLNYSALPKSVVDKAEKLIKSVTYDGKQLLK